MTSGATDPSGTIAAIARAVLYEGYLLWPYRRSAPKNRQRWTFGGLFPEAHHRSSPDDPCRLRAECLLEAADDSVLRARIRFLHPVDRRVAVRRDGALAFVDGLTVDGERHLSWIEATERDIALPPAPLGVLAEAGLHVPLRIAAGRDEERLGGAGNGEGEAGGRQEASGVGGEGGQGVAKKTPATGATGASIVRRWAALEGSAELRAERVGARTFRVAVTVANATPWDGGPRADAQMHALVSTHVVLACDDGAFISLTDPPDEVRDAAAACQNEVVWPVLIGEPPDRSTMLASPIILPDYPRVAPESPGDLFDATEIDQLLVLSILAMSPEEQAEARASDPRAREILDRCAALSPDELMRLHGTRRI